MRCGNVECGVWNPNPYAPMHLCTYEPMHLCTYEPMHLCTYAPTNLCTYAPMHLIPTWFPGTNVEYKNARCAGRATARRAFQYYRIDMLPLSRNGVRGGQGGIGDT